MTDRNGVAFSDIKLGEFRLLDNRIQADLQHLWRNTDLPLTVGIIVDISWSEDDSIPKEREVGGQLGIDHKR